MYTNSINKSNPTGKAIPLPCLTTMTVIVGSGKRRQTFQRPLDSLSRTAMSNTIKEVFFKGNGDGRSS